MRIKDMMKKDESNNDTSTNSPHYFLGNISGHQMRIWILILGCKGLRMMPMDRDYWVLDQSHFRIIWTFCLVHLKSEVLLLQTWLCLFHLVQFFKCWQFFLEWILKDCINVQEKKKKVVVLCSCSPQNMKLGIFLHVVVQWWQRNVQKSMMHLKSCCFANLNLLLFWRSRWRCRHYCLSLLSLTKNMWEADSGGRQEMYI